VSDRKIYNVEYAIPGTPGGRNTAKTILMTVSITLALASLAADLSMSLGIVRDVQEAIIAFCVVIIAAPAALVTAVLAMRRKWMLFIAVSATMALASLVWLAWMTVALVSAWHGRIPISC
jgi:hypothetical protein